MDLVEELGRQLECLNLEVDSSGRERLVWLLEELLRWNRRINLTSVGGGREGIEKHLVDSLTLLPLLFGRERLLDLGSGGGFPCLPLKIARPALMVTSVEAVGKKISFQRHVVRSLGLQGFETLHERAERLPKWSGLSVGFEVVVSRAFSALSDFCAFALPCLAPGGRIVAMKGAAGENELQEASEDLERLGLRCTSVRRFRLPSSRSERTLLILERGST